MSIFTYGIRVNKIFKDEQATAFFTTREIVSSITNLLDAKNSLTEEEFFYVSVVFETFRRINKKLLLDKEGFVNLCNDMIAHFDLIAPYYKFSGSSHAQLMMLQENDKYNYREIAKFILKNDRIFSKNWMQLHKEFLKEFHSFN